MATFYAPINRLVPEDFFYGSTYNSRLDHVDVSFARFGISIDSLEARYRSIIATKRWADKQSINLGIKAKDKKFPVKTLYDTVDKVRYYGNLNYQNGMDSFVYDGVFKRDAGTNRGLRNFRVLPTVPFSAPGYNVRNGGSNYWINGHNAANDVYDRWLDKPVARNEVVSIGYVKRLFTRAIQRATRKVVLTWFGRSLPNNVIDWTTWTFFVPIGFSPMKYLVVCEINTSDTGSHVWSNADQKRVFSFNGDKGNAPFGSSTTDYLLPRVKYDIECAITCTNETDRQFMRERAIVSNHDTGNRSTLNMYFGDRHHGGASVWLLMILKRK